jgi:hypothetical protein
VTISFKLNVLGYRLGTFDINIEMSETATTFTQPVVDRGVKRMARWWTERMCS